MNMAVLIGTLALALFNASKDDISRYFAYAYAVISVGILVRASPSFRVASHNVLAPGLRICRLPA